jgi:4-amino-4-deoxy-L-arabinose transferase-like glycosyltransferase
VDLSVAQAPADHSRPGRVASQPHVALVMIGGIALAVAAFAVYRLTFVERYYDHFVWQASAFLEGQAGIHYPVLNTAERFGNYFFQDVLPVARAAGSERALIPFPPLPAILLVPFVAAFGLRADDQLIFTVLAAVDVALCWWMIGRLAVSSVVRVGTTVLFAFGTVFWYAAQNTTTWYQAHIVAVGLTILAVGLALGADDAATARDDGAAVPLAHPTRTAFMSGLLVGLASTARLTIILATPFFLIVGPRIGWRRRSASVVIGAGLPVVALLAYNVVSTGHVFHPAYDHLYQLEARAYTGLGYHPEWSAEDPRYIPQNLAIMLLSAPQLFPERFQDTLGTVDRPLCTEPGATRGVFDVDCPIALPRDTGMSVVLTTPAFLLAIPAWFDRRRRRIVVASLLAILLVSVVNLMHFSQGWVQFGYRFSNDVVPFALVLVAIGFARLVDRASPRPWAMPLAIGLIVLSVAINAWGVLWGRFLGW